MAETKSSNTGIIITIIVAVLLLSGMITLVVFWEKKKDTNKAPDSDTQQANPDNSGGGNSGGGGSDGGGGGGYPSPVMAAFNPATVAASPTKNSQTVLMSSNNAVLKGVIPGRGAQTVAGGGFHRFESLEDIFK
jgi:hypothetical protein